MKPMAVSNQAKLQNIEEILGSYPYAPMRMSVGGEEIRIGVTDFVGEQPIPNGNYTYRLTYDTAFYGEDGIGGQLTYDQTAVDSTIDKALDEKISKDALDKYYLGGKANRKNEPLYCIHQQTHRQESKNEISVIVYAKVFCVKGSFGMNPGESERELELVPDVPMRFELEKKGDSFSVIDYQSPHTVGYLEGK